MNLEELKKEVDDAIERAKDFEIPLNEIKVGLQIDGPGQAYTCSTSDVELHYDNDGDASGCVITARSA